VQRHKIEAGPNARHASSPGMWVSACLVGAVVCLAVGGCATLGLGTARDRREIRRELFDELRPIAITNCTLKRYGDERDGGYVMCSNLMAEAKAVYSYGISGTDQWGCDVSEQLQLTTHEYDCFDTTRPKCSRGTLQFHEECVGDRQAVISGRPYDTIEQQFVRNGDAGKPSIVKMDVEGSEWMALLATPDAVLDNIDQLAIEFHHVDDRVFVDTVKKLKQHFYVAHFHANNYACDGGVKPFTAWANEVLFVNKRLAVPSPAGDLPAPAAALDAPNRPAHRDCQVDLSRWQPISRQSQ
jgi:hypothetical protein